jgi:Flp pilus assembly protein TadG
MTWKFTSRRRELAGPRRSRGLAATEFVIAVPVLIIVALAVGEIGRAFLQYDRLSYFARNSARFVSEHAIDGTTGVVKIDQQLIDAGKYLVVYGKTTKGNETEACVPKFDESGGTFELVPAAVNGNTDYFRLTVTYPYRPAIGAVLPVFGGDPLNIGAMTMRVVVNMRAIS